MSNFLISSGSSQPMGWTQVSCTAGGFFTSWATGEAPIIYLLYEQLPLLERKLHEVTERIFHEWIKSSF